MASTYNSLGYQLMATGENAGSWGTKTNTTLDEIKETFGYTTVAMTADRTLTIPNGSTDASYDGRAFIIECTGALGANRTLDIALQAGDPAANIEKPFIVFNNTSTSYDLTFKATGATGFVLTQGSTYLCYHNGTDIINTGLGAGDVTLTGTQTLTNKTLTSPKIGTSILDTGGNELMKITVTGSAENEFTMAAGGSGAGPTLSSTGSSDTNIDMNLVPAGTGNVNLSADAVRVGDNNADATITTDGTGDLILNTNAGTNSGTITIADGVDGNINIAPNGNGVVQGSGAAIKIAGLETIFIPAPAMYGTTTAGAGDAQVETTAGRPDMKVFDFDAGTKEYTQFAIAMPKSWNLGTVTYQVFWSPSNTDTGNCIFGLQGLATTEGDTADAVFGTAVEVTDAGIGTVEDVQMSAVSGAVTIAGTPADDDYTFYQLYRDAADVSDTFTGDARVMGIKLFYTTDAANDA